jgi:hypothetical protein
MTDETVRLIVIALIASVPPTLAAVAAVIVALRGNAKLADVHLQINSRMDELLRVSNKAARAEGVEAQRLSAEKAENGGP